MSDRQDINPTPTTPGGAEAPKLEPEFSNRFDHTQLRRTLSDAIRTIVLPRMLERHRAKSAAPARSIISHDDIAALLACVMVADPAPSEAMLETIKLRLATREQVLLDLLAPVADRLAELGRQGEITFADVALGIGRLQGLIRSDCMPAPPELQPGPRGGALIVQMPHEQSGFGTAVVEDLLRTAGWEASRWSGSDMQDLTRRAAERRVDVIGIWIDDPASVADLRALSRRLRLAAGRKSGIVAQGPTLGDLRIIPSDLGVDAIAPHPRDMIAAAGMLLSQG